MFWLMVVACGSSEPEVQLTFSDPKLQCLGEKDIQSCWTWSGNSARSEDFQSARTALEVLCKLEDAEGCWKYGTVLAQGVGGPVKEEASLEALRKSCESGYYVACPDFATALATQQSARYPNIGEVTCVGGAGFMCLGNVGEDETDMAVQKQFSNAISPLRAACENGMVDSCQHLGRILALGWAGEPECDGSMSVLKKACTEASGSACLQLADRFAGNGPCGKEELSRSVEYAKQGCDHGYGLSCGLTAVGYETGTGVEANLDEALRFHKKACTLGDQESCGAQERINAKIH